MEKTQALKQAYLAGGCFWCLEAAYVRIPGIVEVVSGYMGGSKQNPSYEEVCTGSTGHAETVRLAFDPGLIDFGGILELFWKIHDPTTLDRQGADVGDQYRSAIFYADEDQRREAQASREIAQARFSSPIVTRIEAAPRFWPAEDYHQHYFELHPNAGYCRAVIAPKLKKAGLITAPL